MSSYNFNRGLIISSNVMADGKSTEAASETGTGSSTSRVLQHDLEDDLGDEDLVAFLDFPEEVESAIAEVNCVSL